MTGSLSRAKERLNRWLAAKRRTKLGFVVGTTIDRYSADGIAMRAGMVAYFTFLSLFPMMLLIISVTSFLIPPDQAESFTFRLLSNFPDAVRSVVQSNVVSAYTTRGPVTIIGLAALLWSSLYVFTALSVALNLIAPFEENRKWWQIYVRGTMMVALTLVLMLVIFAADAVAQTFGNILGPLLPSAWAQGLVAAGAWIFSLTASFSLFLAIYRWVPSRTTCVKYLWPGALTATLLWKVSKAAITWYLSTLSKNEAVYGSIGTVIAILLWLYVTAIIMLVGAEVNRALSEWRKLHGDSRGTMQPSPPAECRKEPDEPEPRRIA